jgi:hypothetical protein
VIAPPVIVVEPSDAFATSSASIFAVTVSVPPARLRA